MGLLDILNNLGGGPDKSPAEGDAARIAEVEVVLNEVRPSLEMDGGGVQLVRIDDDGVVHLRMFGACSGCHAQGMTLHDGIEPRLARLPWFTGVKSL
ncbi:MAG: NifU family protein [Planctomycetota bacterium]|nr:NifU family protein [Planctomycetota bacterium]